MASEKDRREAFMQAAITGLLTNVSLDMVPITKKKADQVAEAALIVADCLLVISDAQ